MSDGRKRFVVTQEMADRFNAMYPKQHTIAGMGVGIPDHWESSEKVAFVAMSVGTDFEKAYPDEFRAALEQLRRWSGW